MSDMRERLVLEDRFSNPLQKYASGLGKASDATRRMAQGAQSGAEAISQAWKGAERYAADYARTAAQNREYVSDIQSQATRAVSGGYTDLGGGANQIQAYAQAVVNARNEVNSHRMALRMEAQALQDTVAKYGSGSEAARAQAEAVNRAADAANICKAKLNAYNVVLRDVAGGSREAAKAIEEYRSSTDRAAKGTSGLIERVKGLAGAYLGLRGLNQLANLSDSTVQTRARLELVNDGSMSTDALQKMIFDSAQRSRGDYMGTADMVSKMGIMAGDAFQNDPKQIVAFTETLNKMYTVSGTNMAGQQAATLQLEQAMAMGVLRGQEFRSVVQQVPMLVQAVADTLGVSTGEVKKLADEGRITANVVKNAMFNAADQVNAKFETMPMTWGQVWTSMKNTAIIAMQPILNAVNWLANNIKIIAPLVVAAGAAFVVFQIAAHWTAISAAVLGVYHVAQTFAAAGFLLMSGNAAGAAATIGTLNSVLAANPIALIVMAIVVLIGLFYAGVAAFNKFTGSAVSATGIITGAFATAGAFIANVFFGLVEIVGGVIEFWYNGFAAFANFFGNLFNDPIGSVIHLFGDLADRVLGVIEKIASAMDFVFGSNFASAVAGWRSNLASMTESAANRYGNGSYEKLVQNFDLDATLADLGLGMERFNYGDAYQAGYDWGSNLSLGDLFGGAGEDFDFSGMAQDLGSIAGDTKKISANVADEDLKYLEDVAIRRYEANVNTTQLVPNITVQVNGESDKSVGVDIANTLKVMLAEQLASHTTATYAGV